MVYGPETWQQYVQRIKETRPEQGPETYEEYVERTKRTRPKQGPKTREEALEETPIEPEETTELKPLQGPLTHEGYFYPKLLITSRDPIEIAIAKQQMQEEYGKIPGVPSQIYKRLEKDVPEDVKYLGLEHEYIKTVYEESIGYTEKEPGIIGPSRTPSMIFKKKYETTFEKLPSGKKFEYGLLFSDIKDVSVEKWKYYEGGLEYIRSHPTESIKLYVEQQGGWKNINMDLYKYASMGGIYSGKKPSDPKLLRSHVWEKITLTPEERRKQYWEVLPSPAKWYSAGFHATLSAAVWPITLIQTGVKYATGEGSLTDPIGRIQTGKTFGPDVGKTLQAYKLGGPSGIISTGISEGIGIYTGKGSDAWKEFTKDPISGLFATGGELFGLYLGGKGLHYARVGTVRGLGHIRSGIVNRTGWNLPTYTTWMKYRPSNIIRTIYWKGKEKLGRAKYIPEEEIWDPYVLSGSKKFAEVPGARQQLKMFEQTRTLTKTGDIATIHASPYRFHWLSRFSKGTSETPGLSVSAYTRGSPHFLQVTGPSSMSYHTSKISLLPRLHRPTGPIVYLKNIFRLPKKLRTKGYDATGKYILDQPKGKYGWIAPKSEMGGPELEAIITGGTIAKRTSSYYYTTYQGVIVPLPEYTVIQSGIPEGFSFTTKVVESAKEFIGISSSGQPTTPLISPGYFVSEISKTPSIPSVPSSEISIPSSLSSVPSSMTSVPSSLSKPSSKTVSIPSSSKSSKESFISTVLSSVSKPSSPSYPSIPSIPSIPSSPGSSYIPSVSMSFSYRPRISMDSSIPVMKTEEQGFNVKVKDRMYVKGKKTYTEKFIKINKEPLTKLDALSLGSAATDNSAAASFTIIPTNEKPQRLPFSVTPWNVVSHKFYKKNNRYIERKTFRIDSLGEVEGISALGWVAQRRKQTKPIKIKSYRPKQIKELSIDTMDMMDIDKQMQKIMRGAMNGF